jgi:hypothetical protein
VAQALTLLRRAGRGDRRKAGFALCWRLTKQQEAPFSEQRLLL